MENYKVIQRLGVGTFGSCVKALDIRTQQFVAIKTLRSDNTDESRNQEIQSLRRFNNINVIKLIEVIKQNRKISIVMEYVEKDLLHLYQQVQQQGRLLPEEQIKSIMYQVCSGLMYMHDLGYFHRFIQIHIIRDIKPENIMIGENGVVKLIDLGQAKQVQQNIADHTDYVSTRWYRAPEQLSGCGYGNQIDIWALGCVMSELFLLRPLLPGTSDIDQLAKIQAFFGTLKEQWPQGWSDMQSKGVYEPTTTGEVQSVQNNDEIKNLYSNIPQLAIDLLSQLFQINPNNRISIQGILSHPWLSNKNQFLPKSLQENESDDKYLIEQSPLLVDNSKIRNETSEKRQKLSRATVMLQLPKTPQKRNKSTQNDEIQTTIQLKQVAASYIVTQLDEDEPIFCQYVPSQNNNRTLQKRNARRIINSDSSPPPPQHSQNISQELQMQYNTLCVDSISKTFNERISPQGRIQMKLSQSKISLQIPAFQREGSRIQNHIISNVSEYQEPVKASFFSKPLQLRSKQ